MIIIITRLLSEGSLCHILPPLRYGQLRLRPEHYAKFAGPKLVTKNDRRPGWLNYS